MKNDPDNLMVVKVQMETVSGAHSSDIANSNSTAAIDALVVQNLNNTIQKLVEKNMHPLEKAPLKKKRYLMPNTRLGGLFNTDQVLAEFKRQEDAKIEAEEKKQQLKRQREERKVERKRLETERSLLQDQKKAACDKKRAALAIIKEEKQKKKLQAAEKTLIQQPDALPTAAEVLVFARNG